MQFTVIHPGTQYAIRVAEQLALRGYLREFCTGVGFSKSSPWFGFAETCFPSLMRRLENRASDVISSAQIRCLPAGELALLAKQYSGRARSDDFEKRNHDFQLAIPDRVFYESDAVVGYDTSSWILASRCHKAKKPLILDQSIGHSSTKERVFEQLRNRYPDWAHSIPRQSDAAKRNEYAEHAAASVIVAPSSFVVETLVSAGVDANKVVAIPFGTNTKLFKPPRKARTLDLIRFLFVGGLSARKGVPDLLAAWKAADIPNAELWLAGTGEIPNSVRFSLPASIKFLGKLDRNQVSEKMRQANALLFPSHFEGLAQVQIEAIACGLPVIGTYQSGATDLIDSGINGCIVQAGNVDQLIDLLSYLHRNREVLSLWENNIITSSRDLSWDAYGQTWVQQVVPRVA